MYFYTSYIQHQFNLHMKQIDIKEHFKVPEGYFENFTQQMIAQLPEQNVMPASKPGMPKLWSRIAVSAAVVLAFTTTWYAMNSLNSVAHTADASAAAPDTEYAIDDVVDYAMLDHQDIYRYLME